MDGTAGSNNNNDEQEGEEEEEDEPEDIVNNFPSESNIVQLKVSEDIKQMLRSIFQYNASNITLPTPLRPFIPDFQPAIGDLDSFIKIPRPDGGRDMLGLTVIDEPGPEQSNPSVLEMKLKKELKPRDIEMIGGAGVSSTNGAETDRKGSRDGPRASSADRKKKQVEPPPERKPKVDTVRTVDINEKGALGLQSWIRNLDEYHKQRPSPSVAYMGPMPPLESLMQVWPQEYENQLRTLVLPALHHLGTDMPIDNFARLVLSLLDIPVHASNTAAAATASTSTNTASNVKGIKESLHVLFSLFSEFKQNPHFRLVDPKELFGAK